ncbi:MAG: mycothiol synthase [Microthrixaceae bacterium]
MTGPRPLPPQLRADALEWVAFDADSDERQLRSGLVRVRLLDQWRRPLPLEHDVVSAAAPIAVRAVVPDADDDALLHVNNRAFAWHPDQGGWTTRTLSERRAEGWYRDEDVLVHDAPDHAGRIDAFCWTKLHPATDGEPVLGEIYAIGVDPSAHGTGLGRAITVAGLEHLTRRGAAAGMLYVEHDNVPALRMYERLGFTLHDQRAAYLPAADAHRLDLGLDLGDPA